MLHYYFAFWWFMAHFCLTSYILQPRQKNKQKNLVIPILPPLLYLPFQRQTTWGQGLCLPISNSTGRYSFSKGYNYLTNKFDIDPGWVTSIVLPLWLALSFPNPQRILYSYFVFLKWKGTSSTRLRSTWYLSTGSILKFSTIVRQILLSISKASP